MRPDSPPCSPPPQDWGGYRGGQETSLRTSATRRALALGALLLGALLAASLGPTGGRAQDAGDWVVAREAVNLRAGPAADAGVLTVMPPGARLEVLGDGSGDWLPVRYAGQAGYAARTYLAA